MPTTVTKSIGTSSRDYSTLQSWEDASPANLVTADQVWKGECYNDSEFTGAATLLTISGQTVDATRYVWLTTATGQSFRDNANVQTNALRYNQSNGVGILSNNTTRTAVISISTQYTVIEKLQVKTTASGYAGSWPVTVGAANVTLKNCIFEDTDTAYNGYVVSAGQQSGFLMVNCLVKGHAQSNNGAANGVIAFKFGEIVNCTIALTGTISSGNGLTGGSYDSGMGTVTNGAVFGFTGFRSGTLGTFVTCATDLASAPSGVATSKTYSSQFENVTNGTHDYRAKSGGYLLDSGTTDSRASPDIAGTTRPSGSAYDIGCWELVSASPSAYIGARFQMIGSGIQQFSGGRAA